MSDESDVDKAKRVLEDRIDLFLERIFLDEWHRLFLIHDRRPFWELDRRVQLSL
jgi:hypothetical protein